MRRVTLCVVALALLALPSLPRAQAGKLQIHFMDVGQGDGAILIAPDGETVLFDNGVWGSCAKPMAYLQSLGITKIDYQVISHYHRDHYGCTATVLAKFPLLKFSYDRGGSYHDALAFGSYTTAVGTKRRSATEGETITLNGGVGTPVIIRIAALNGNGVVTDNENDESVVSLVSFGNFRAELGGDLSGFTESGYADIETSVAPKIGQVDVYKVHHHGSPHSTNTAWLQSIQPRIGIVSSGDTNDYGHPSQECIERLHDVGVKLFWTEHGKGVPPEEGFDTVGGTIVVDVPSGGSTYTVRTTTAPATMTTFNTWITTDPGPTPTTSSYVWSKNSNVYHYATCKTAQTISAANRQTGAMPPAGKTLHKDCPK
jgi:beta-lactamase superfamily II metal-dependent hydrolase